jgi:hypothetical protein
MKRIGIALALLALSGCTLGIKEDGSNALHDSFHVDATYQETFRRADAFARHCHTSTNMLAASFNVSGNLYTDKQAGEVRVNLPSAGRDLEIIRVAASADGGASVSVDVWNRNRWDERELAAARRSIESGTPTCR